MEYKIVKTIRQNKTWIEANIPYINLTPSRYNALVPAISAYVSNDVTIPVDSMTSQMNTMPTQETLLQAHVNRTEIVLNSGIDIHTIFLNSQELKHQCLTVLYYILEVIRWSCLAKRGVFYGCIYDKITIPSVD